MQHARAAREDDTMVFDALAWPPTSTGWIDYVRKPEVGPRAVSVLKRLLEKWHASEKSGDESALDGLLDTNEQLAALYVAIERKVPGALDLLLRIQCEPEEFEDASFGDLLADVWEPAALMLSQSAEDVHLLARTVLDKGASVLGRTAALTGLGTLSTPANNHPLASAARAQLTRVLAELSPCLAAPEHDLGDCEVFSDALSSVVLFLAPHSPAEKTRYLSWYDHPRAETDFVLGSREHFVEDLERTTPMGERANAWPFQSWPAIEQFYGTDEAILTERAREATALRDLFENQLKEQKKRDTKRKTQKVARTTSRKK